MKHNIIKVLTIAALPFAVACGSGKSEEQTTEGTAKTSEAAAAAAEIDPICEMEKDSSWTDYSVYKGDTVWFCGEGCKQAFDARPEKYMGKKG